MAGRIVDTNIKIIKAEKRETMAMRGESYFKKNGYLIPKRATGGSLYDAWILKEQARINIYIPGKDMLNTSMDYVRTADDGYLMTDKAKKFYGREFSLHKSSVLQIIVEESVKRTQGTNLWCEGIAMEPHYYLMVLEYVDFELYTKVKRGIEARVPCIKSKDGSQEMLNAGNKVIKLGMDQIGHTLSYMAIEENKRKVVERMHMICSESNRIIDEFNKKYKGRSDIEEFVRQAQIIVAAHSKLELVATAKQRFSYTLKRNPQISVEFELPGNYIPVDPIKDYDLNNGLLQKYSEKATSAIYTASLVNDDAMLDSGIPILPFIAPIYSSADANDSDETAMKHLELLVLNMKKNKEFSIDEVEEFLKAGWTFNSGKALVSPRSPDIMIPPNRLRSFLVSSRGLAMVKVQEKADQGVKIPKYDQYSPAPKMLLNSAQIEQVIKNNPTMAPLFQDMLVDSVRTKKVDVAKDRIKAEVGPVINNIMRNQRESFVTDITAKLRASNGYIAPSTEYLSFKMIKFLSTVFAGSAEGKEIQRKIDTHGLNLYLFNMPEISALIKNAVKTELNDKETVWRYYLADFTARTSENIDTLLIDGGLTEDHRALLTRAGRIIVDINDAIQEEPANYYNAVMFYAELSNLNLKENGETGAEDDDARSLMSVNSVLALQAADMIGGLHDESASIFVELTNYLQAGDYGTFDAILVSSTKSESLLKVFGKLARETALHFYEPFNNKVISMLEVGPVLTNDICRGLFCILMMGVLGYACQADFEKWESMKMNSARKENLFKKAVERADLFGLIVKYFRELICDRKRFGIREYDPIEDKCDVLVLLKEYLDQMNFVSQAGTSILDEFLLFYAFTFSGYNVLPQIFRLQYRVNGGVVVAENRYVGIDASDVKGVAFILMCCGEVMKSRMFSFCMRGSTQFALYQEKCRSITLLISDGVPLKWVRKNEAPRDSLMQYIFPTIKGEVYFKFFQQIWAGSGSVISRRIESILTRAYDTVRTTPRP